MDAGTAEFHKLVAMTEACLCKWLSRRMKEDGSVSRSQLCEQARLIYATMCKKKNITSPPSFVASDEWLANFNIRYQVKLTKFHDEVAFGDVSEVESYPAIVTQIVEDGEVTEDSVMDSVNFDPKRNINEMFGNHSDSSSDDRKEEPEVIESVTTGKLSKILADCSDMKESLQRFVHDAPELQNALPLLDNLSEILMKVFYHKIDEKQQTVMNNFYRRRLDQANKIQSLDIPDGQEGITTPNHQHSEEPDFEGFENH